MEQELKRIKEVLPAFFVANFLLLVIGFSSLVFFGSLSLTDNSTLLEILKADTGVVIWEICVILFNFSHIALGMAVHEIHQDGGLYHQQDGISVKDVEDTQLVDEEIEL